MEYAYKIFGKNKVSGAVNLKGAKNSVLPLISASLLACSKVELVNIPNISDIDEMLYLVEVLGCTIERYNSNLVLSTQSAKYCVINSEHTQNIRASIFMLGSMLTRFSYCDLSLPGGCKIGERKIDIHLDSLEQMGAKIEIFENRILVDGQGLHPADLHFRYPSVGATINVILASVELGGITTIFNPAREPEVIDLCKFLNALGYMIVGAGSNKISIYGRKIYPKSITFKPIGDRIVAGTLLALTTMVGGEILLSNLEINSISALIPYFKACGGRFSFFDNAIYYSHNGKNEGFKKITTTPFPGFPTDLQSIFTAVGIASNKRCVVTEKVFECRFSSAKEFAKFGARLKIDKDSLYIFESELSPAVVTATDLRAGAGLVLLALSIEGESIVKNISLIERGYEDFDLMLSSLGQNITKIKLS